MILQLAQDAVTRLARAAAREQAWVDARGVLGVPLRRDGHPDTGAHADLTRIGELLDEATCVRWTSQELTICLRYDVEHHLQLARPGHEHGGDQIDITTGSSTAVRRAHPTRTARPRSFSRTHGSWS